ncbi:tetratricopeptide repeat protein [Humibacillus sp. DSM 29435]|uniref:tetratricopeptide repeat protein n=1 Tax=Humibacillus sp. DSM 29435 TaxID=1869167 RepID=UPI001113084F|nr:tetratricopeptide repeat protein [Humibacillus sp. DSM 29435]
MDLPLASSRRVLVVAAAGYGKSALLEQLRPAAGVAVPAARAVEVGLPRSSWLGIENVDRLSTPDAARLLDLVAGLNGTSVVLTSRVPLCAEVRSHLRGPVFERGPADLALDPYAVAVCLARDHGVTDPEVALQVAELTAGWPTLVHFAGDALERHPSIDVRAQLGAPDGPAAHWLNTEVLSALTASQRRMLCLVAGLGPVTQLLCDRLDRAGEAPSGTGEMGGLVDLLEGLGLLVPVRRMTETELVMVPAVADLVAGVGQTAPSPGLSDEQRWSVAADVHTANGAWLPAAHAQARRGDAGSVAAILVKQGENLLRRGDAAGIVSLAGALVTVSSRDDTRPRDPLRERSARLLRRTYAEALRRSGDVTAARRAFAPLVEQAERVGWDAGLAARVAQLHYTKGEFTCALAVLDEAGGHPAPMNQVGVACESSTLSGLRTGTCFAADVVEDEVDQLACRVHVLAVLGRASEATPVAERVLALAEADGGDRVLGVAHLAAARLAHGARKEAHHEQALRSATRANDLATAARVLGAQTHLLLAQARYSEACAGAREAVRLAELSSPPGLRAAALHNLAEALQRTGHYPEARWHLQRSVAICRRLGPARAALGLVGMGDAHGELGHDEQARACYVEAVELARGSGDTQVLVAALSGMARLEAEQAPGANGCDEEDGQRTAGAGVANGRVAAEEASRLAGPDSLPMALTALGWCLLQSGEHQAARECAHQALAAARETRAVDLVAGALLLCSETAGGPASARAYLEEALSIWHGGGAVVAAAKVSVMLGRLVTADSTDRSRAREATRLLQRLGVSRVHGRPLSQAPTAATVVVEVLGTFAVRVAGVDVPLPAWRSRQARTLVKILAAHRGRVVTRARLCELLWPDDDPARTGHRLSVLLATVRGVLDPLKAWPADHYIAADQHGIRLVLPLVEIDAEALLGDARHAGELIERGDDELALEILSHVDARYRGDAFEEEPAEEWADALREEVRAAWVRSVRRLATLQARRGRGGDALGLFVRLLSVDPYDEQVHRRLVLSLTRAGRHGEAARAFQRWVSAMREIDAPTPDAALLTPAVSVVTPH